ncbi:MAG TPA: hemerythrin domain-containing protein [Vitreimonas sp.]|uniref:hemerythrin domain-containing protein n=1 Tax=Vitreimonas sp. TaxID=3069702 RepID=UPI002D2BDBB3|nr:hemerythrin domain-containing protein [Vitreimonas sp.]HYD87327.1 hemerythrin domain-containing protein [Vitreimonas sp.]
MERNRMGEIALSAGLGFAAGALLANPARKLAMQGAEALTSRDWVDALTMEHRAVAKIFDTLLETDESEPGKRKSGLHAIDHALTKHALQEELAIYPALRRIDEQQAQHLFADHVEVKTFLSELQFDIEPNSPAWIVRLREFKEAIDQHIREEENEIFPAFRDRMSEEENLLLTKHMHMQGMKVV